MHAGPAGPKCHTARKSRQLFFILSGKAADQGKTWTRARVGRVPAGHQFSFPFDWRVKLFRGAVDFFRPTSSNLSEELATTTPFYRKELLQILLGTAILAMSNLAAVAQANTIKPAYDFSLSREEKIKLAESAAPPEVSSKATVYVLDGAGYVKVRDGSNGFSCFVDREAPVNLEPTCFDTEGKRNDAPYPAFCRGATRAGEERGPNQG
jgi:hypothetical protein